MPRLDYKTCKHCGEHASVVGPLSHTRLCRDCALEREVFNNDGISTHTGPAFTRWRRQIAASVGGVLLDDLQAET